MLGLLVALSARPLAAQADYLNTDRARPLSVQDAMPVERHAVEFAPLQFASQRAGGESSWSAHPSLAWGVLPRTQVQLSSEWTRGAVAGGSPEWRNVATELSVLHALTVETRTLPAIALEGSFSEPTAHRSARHYAATAIATRTFATSTRLHANAGWLADESAGNVTLTGWEGGLAVDHPFPFRYLLIGGEVVARQRPALARGTSVEAAIGARWQGGIHWVVNGGASRTLRGELTGWSFTLGSSYATAFSSLIPGGAK